MKIFTDISFKAAAVAALCLIAAAGLSACQGRRTIYRVDKPIHHELSAAEAQLLDLRFSSGRIHLLQADSDDTITVSGSINVLLHDDPGAGAQALDVDLRITEGRYTLVELPEAPPGAAYEVDLEVAVPRGVDLHIKLGTGYVNAEIDLPNKTDLEVTVGVIEMALPLHTPTRVTAETYVGDVSIDDLEIQAGKVERQLVSSGFDGQIGPANYCLPEARLGLLINTGSISLTATQ